MPLCPDDTSEEDGHQTSLVHTAGWSRNHRMRHSFNSAAATQLPRCELLSGNPTFPIRRNVRLAMHGGCTYCSDNGITSSAFAFVPYHIALHRIAFNKTTTKCAHCVQTLLSYSRPHRLRFRFALLLLILDFGRRRCCCCCCCYCRAAAFIVIVGIIILLPNSRDR